MSYVFMKVLESAPQRYERGMRLLTLGRLAHVRQDIAARVRARQRVLDIGCGTGALLAMLAHKGAHVTGIDISPPMLSQAARRVREEDLADRVVLKELSAVDLDTEFQSEDFDTVVSVLVLSELSDDEIAYALAESWRILRPDGRLLIADEVLPDSKLGRIGTSLLRLPFVIAAYVLTQNTTRRVAGLEARIAGAGFQILDTEAYLMGTMRLVIAGKAV
jgi:demethylmenaquinone methyltransferase/2-methoxy-6-polyprenyl-1,4-benzoquinol methylase